MPHSPMNITNNPIGVGITINGSHIIGRGILSGPPGVGMIRPIGQYLKPPGPGTGNTFTAVAIAANISQ